jgi:signal peptidase II
VVESIIFSLAVVLFDQLTKIYIKGISLTSLGLDIQGITPGEKHPVFSDILSITLLENPGFAFGIYPGIEYKFLLTIVTLLLTAGLFVYLYQSSGDTFRKRLAAALLIGGAAGNLIDRIFYGILYEYAPLFYGSVVDFINIRVTEFFFFEKMTGNYVFNFADISVTAGLLIMMFSLQTSEQPEIKPIAVENQD